MTTDRPQPPTATATAPGTPDETTAATAEAASLVKSAETTSETADEATPEATPEAGPVADLEEAGEARSEAASEPSLVKSAEASAGAGPEAVLGQAGAGAAGTGDGLPGEEAPAGAQGPVVKKDRRVLRAVLRWTAVVTAFAALGAGTAYGITRMERTDIPGLATESDGRWVYPEITRPPLPSGSPSPFDTKNWAQSHYADLRALLLPAPEGATDDKTLRGADGWLPTKDFLTVFEAKEDRDDVGRLLVDNGLRHIAARGWTTPDGTGTRVYLLQFETGTVADTVYGELTTYGAPLHAVRGAAVAEFDDTYPTAADFDSMSVMRYSYDEVKPYGAEQLRQAYLRAGDIIALVFQSRKGTAEAVPFQQTVTLQSQLLG